jgi:hypothetical protein
MPITTLPGRQIADGTVSRADLNAAGSSGSTVIRRLIAGTNISISSTGTDTGTGDVTVNLSGPIPFVLGGTGQTTRQTAIDSLTAVAGASNEQVLTKDTTTGNAIFKPAPSTASDAISFRGVNIAASPTNGQIYQHDGTDFKLVTLGTQGIWIAWTPTIGAVNGTFTSALINKARYRRRGDRVDFQLDVQGTLGTTPDYLTFTLPPITVIGTNPTIRGIYWGNVALTGLSAGMISGYINTTEIRAYRGTGASFADTTTFRGLFSGYYECANV